MSHTSSKASYQNLAERLNRFPQGAPASDTLYQILAVLFSEKEAALVAQLPIKPFTARMAAAIWRMSENDAEKILSGLASRCILLVYLNELIARQKAMDPDTPSELKPRIES